MASEDQKILTDPNQIEKHVYRPDITFKESQNFYTKWAQFGTYDEVHHQDKNIYKGQEMLGEAMATLFSDKANVRVLDVGAGTGLTGEKLRELGYTNIDALEPIEKFSHILREKGFYGRVLNQAVGVDIPVDAPENSYDAACIVGAFGPGAIPPSALLEFIRVIKPGGFIVNCMREEYMWTVPQYKDKLVPFLKDLETQGRIQQVEWTGYPDHFQDKAGVRMVYRVC